MAPGSLPDRGVASYCDRDRRATLEAGVTGKPTGAKAGSLCPVRDGPLKPLAPADDEMDTLEA